MLFLYMSIIDNNDEKNNFECIYDTYKDMMYYKALSILHDEYLAQDAVHDAFLKIIKNMDKFCDINCEKTKGLLVIIIRHTAIDLYRKQKVRDYVSLDDETNYKYYSSYEPDMLSLDIAEILTKLPNKYREVLELRYTYGYSYKEIAQILGAKTQTVGMRLKRGKKLLQKLIIEGSGVEWESS